MSSYFTSIQRIMRDTCKSKVDVFSDLDVNDAVKEAQAVCDS